MEWYPWASKIFMLHLNVEKKPWTEKSLYGEAYKINTPVSLLLSARRDVYTSSTEIPY